MDLFTALILHQNDLALKLHLSEGPLEKKIQNKNKKTTFYNQFNQF